MGKRARVARVALLSYALGRRDVRWDNLDALRARATRLEGRVELLQEICR